MDTSRGMHSEQNAELRWRKPEQCCMFLTRCPAYPDIAHIHVLAWLDFYCLLVSQNLPFEGHWTHLSQDRRLLSTNL